VNKTTSHASIHEVPALWRQRAAEWRRVGADAQAKTAEILADELAEALSFQDEKPLTLADAARECGYNADSLGRLVREGKLPNAGRPNAPRILRRDLPHKVPSSSSSREDSRLSRSQIAGAVINRFDQRGER